MRDLLDRHYLRFPVHRAIYCGAIRRSVKAPSFYRRLFKDWLWDWEDDVAIVSPMSAPAAMRIAYSIVRET